MHTEMIESQGTKEVKWNGYFYRRGKDKREGCWTEGETGLGTMTNKTAEETEEKTK